MPNPSELARLEEEQGILNTPGITSTNVPQRDMQEDILAAIETITGKLEDMVPPAGSDARGPRVPKQTERKRRRVEVRDSRRTNR